jgi:hypothetical protein
LRAGRASSSEETGPAGILPACAGPCRPALPSRTPSDRSLNSPNIVPRRRERGKGKSGREYWESSVGIQVESAIDTPRCCVYCIQYKARTEAAALRGSPLLRPCRSAPPHPTARRSARPVPTRRALPFGAAIRASQTKRATRRPPYLFRGTRAPKSLKPQVGRGGRRNAWNTPR